MTSRSATAKIAGTGIVDAVASAGIVGMGGGGFPTHVKLDAAADTVVANGAECEPLLWSDKRLVAERAEEVADGLLLAMEAVGASGGVLAVKEHYGEVVAAAKAAVRRADPSGGRLSVHALPNIYPAGDEFTLVHMVTGRVIPEMGLPLHVGVVVSNVASLAAVSRAVRSGRPSTHRFVTITGEVAVPGVYEAPVGTSVADLIAAAGGTGLSDPAVVLGGPMMGPLATGLDQPITKTTSALVVLPQDHLVVRDRRRDPRVSMRLARAACCQCAACTEVCPRNSLGHHIFPDRLMRSLAGGLTNDHEAYLGAMLCCECGLCTLQGCPMGLDPRGMNVLVKRKLREQGAVFDAVVEPKPNDWWALKQVPVPRLRARLDLERYERHLPFAGPVRPQRLVLSMRQGAGAPSKPVVAAGDSVAEGQVVAEPGGRIGSVVHSPMAGKVESVTEDQVVVRASQGGRR